MFRWAYMAFRTIQVYDAKQISISSSLEPLDIYLENAFLIENAKLSSNEEIFTSNNV